MALHMPLEITLGNESYAKLKVVAWIGELSEMGLRCHLERSMLGSEPYARLCRCFWKEHGDGLKMPSGESRTLDFVPVFEWSYWFVLVFNQICSILKVEKC